MLRNQAAGLPVVAGESGGAPDAVRDRETGFVVDGEDVPAVADRIALLLANPERAREMGRAGRARVEQHYDARVNGPALVDALLGVAGQGVAA